MSYLKDGSTVGGNIIYHKGNLTEVTTVKSGTMSAADKTKLDGIEASANNYVHPSTHAATVIVEDSTHRFITDTERTNWGTAYTHSQAAHAPSNAQKNSDITLAEIEAKLVGNITSHTHSYLPLSGGTVTGATTFSGTLTGALTGNASTATKLATARTINGVSFDGSANITVADSTKLPLTGGTVNGDVTIQNAQATLRLYDPNTSTGNYPRILFDTNNTQGVMLYQNEFDGEILAGEGSALILAKSPNSTSLTDVSFEVEGNIYSNGQRVWHAGDFANNSTNWNTAYTHSQAAHAPSNAQKNSDILKSEIEAKLTGEIASHTHAVAGFNGGVITNQLTIRKSGTTLWLGDTSVTDANCSFILGEADKYHEFRYTGSEQDANNSLELWGHIGATTARVWRIQLDQIVRFDNTPKVGTSDILHAGNVATLTRGSYLTGSNFNGTSATTWAVDATSANTASKVVARDASGNFSAGTITAALSGNATTATTLQTARTINGVSFNGSANITIADSTKLPLTGGTVTGNTVFDAGTSTTVDILCDDAGEAVMRLMGSGGTNGSGRIYCGQGENNGGGIEYNGDGTPSSSGAGANNNALYRSYEGTLNWVARWSTTSNNVEFRANVEAASMTVGGATVLHASNVATLTRGTYLTGSNFNGTAATTWAVDATSANTASKVVARDASGNFSAGTITATLSGNASTASSAAKLTTARTINGVSFDGTANITVADSTKLPLTGGSLTGNLVFGSNATINMTTPAGGTTLPVMSCSGGDVNGISVELGGGARTIVGAGESVTATKDNTTGTTETLYLTSDGGIEFYTNMNSGWASKVVMGLSAAGNLTVAGTVAASGGSSTDWNTAYTHSQASHAYLPLAGGTMTGNLTVDCGDNSTVNVICNDAGESVLNLMGAGQGTGRLFVGQSSTYGGGIEYNGDNVPASSGAGSDMITLYRISAGTMAWTARNSQANNNWEFRDDVKAVTFTTTSYGTSANWKAGYDHSLVAHAPSNAQANADITKAEIEAKLIGAITSHTHSYLPLAGGTLSGALTVTGTVTATGGSSTDWNTAYTHSQAAHAPSNAQKNSDILKAEVEAVLTGTITSHDHTNDHTHSNKSTLDTAGTNCAGNRTISTSAPSGGSDGDIWYQIDP